METKLHNVDTMQAKVSVLEESTGELGAQQDMLSMMVERINLAQTQLATMWDAAPRRHSTHRMVDHSTSAAAGKEMMMTRVTMTLCPRHTS
jgi:hypothetical protein